MQEHQPTPSIFDLREYKPLRERLPDFDSKFNPDEGWSVEIEVIDALSLKPGLLKLYEQCIKENRDFEAAGLPPIPKAAESMVFIARLYNANRQVIRSASTHQNVVNVKDYEKAETRARQRLVAACGFDGNMLDEDERTDVIPDQFDIDSLDIEPEPEDCSADLEDSQSGSEASASAMPASGSTIPPGLQNNVDQIIARLEASGKTYVVPTDKRSCLKFIREHQGGSDEG